MLTLQPRPAPINLVFCRDIPGGAVSTETDYLHTAPEAKKIPDFFFLI